MSFFENPNNEIETVRYWIKKAYFCYKLGTLEEYNHILHKILPQKLEVLSEDESYREQKLETLLQKEYEQLEHSWLIGECVVALLQKTKKRKPWYAYLPIFGWFYKRKQRTRFFEEVKESKISGENGLESLFTANGKKTKN